MFNDRKLSAAGLALIEGFEGCRLEAYADGGGVWTIGYGHTGPEVHEGLTWTQEQATAALLADTKDAQDAVNLAVTAQIGQNRFDALVSFTFNVGIHALDKSTLLRELNAENVMAAAAEFLRWDRDAKGAIEPGLFRRRVAERDLFMRPDGVA
jgi:lysozyme